MPRIGRTIGMLLLGLLAGSALFEAYLRIAEATPLWRVLPVAEASLYAPSADTGYTHRPGARGTWITENRVPIAINALGLRDLPDRQLEKRTGTRRIAVIGDFFVEALQVPVGDTFVALTEAELRRQQATPPTEVINVGLAGSTPAVTVARTRMAAEQLSIDGAVVVLNMGDLLRTAVDEDAAFPGYVPAAGGKAVLSHAYREGRGYRLRTGPVGRGIYWSLDRIRLALVLNNRANAGLAADLGGLAPRRRPSATVCGDAPHLAATRLWRGEDGSFAGARLAALLDDLSGTARRHGIRIVLAVRGLSGRCAGGAVADTLTAAAAQRITAADLGFLDVDGAVRTVTPAGDTPSLYGFGARIGEGHLNQAGHRVYAEVLTRATTASFQGRP